MSVWQKIPILGNFFNNSESTDLQNAMNQASASYSALRPQYAQAYQNAKMNSLGALSGEQALLAHRYGRGVLPHPGTQDPMGSNMLSTGTTQVTPGEGNDVLAGIGSGAMLGGVYGAGAGTMVEPGYGTAIGGAVGAVGGGLLGGINAATSNRADKSRLNIPAFRTYRTGGQR
jgi:hypothetical protein